MEPGSRAFPVYGFFPEENYAQVGNPTKVVYILNIGRAGVDKGLLIVSTDIRNEVYPDSDAIDF
jgi:hypothetical protein